MSKGDGFTFPFAKKERAQKKFYAYDFDIIPHDDFLNFSKMFSSAPTKLLSVVSKPIDRDRQAMEVI